MIRHKIGYVSRVNSMWSDFSEELLFTLLLYYLRYFTLGDVKLNYITLRYVTSRRYITLHYIASLFILSVYPPTFGTLIVDLQVKFEILGTRLPELIDRGDQHAAVLATGAVFVQIIRDVRPTPHRLCVLGRDAAAGLHATVQGWLDQDHLVW